MLPFCERTMSVARNDIAPVWTRSVPVSKQPKTIGEHLRKQRFKLGIRQSQAAQRLGVSEHTMSVWERNQIYPTWAYQPRLIEYLGYDPFTDSALGGPKGNETPSVAALAPNTPLTLGQQISVRRLKSKKTRQQCAKELGVDTKTLRGWEAGRHQPFAYHFGRISRFLGYEATLPKPTSGSC